MEDGDIGEVLCGEGQLLLLSDFTRRRRRLRSGPAEAVLGEGRCELQAACLPWRGWDDASLGTIGGEAEATFETLRNLAAFDGDWLEVSAGSVSRLVRVKAVDREAPCSCCAGEEAQAGTSSPCTGKARRDGVLYLRRAVLGILLRGVGSGDFGALYDCGEGCDSFSRTHLWARRYSSITTDGREKAVLAGSDSVCNACPIAAAARVELARVACPNSSGSSTYTRELRTFFEGASEVAGKSYARTRETPSSSTTWTYPHIVSEGDIFGVWVRRPELRNNEVLDSSEDEESDEPCGQSVRSMPRNLEQGTCVQHEHHLVKPGHDLVRFCVVALEATAHGSAGGTSAVAHAGLAVDVNRTLVSCQGTVHTAIPGAPPSIIAHMGMAPGDMQDNLLAFLAPLFHARTAALGLPVSVLVHGPPGSGKSSGVKAMASVLGVNVLEASCAKFALGRLPYVAY